MQKYQPKTWTAEISDRIFRFLFACMLGIGWFVLLWGVSLPALLSGLAFAILLWLCVRQFSKRISAKRESHMRRMIGGEMAVDRLVWETPRRALLYCALWLASDYPIENFRIENDILYTTRYSKPMVMFVIQQHPSVAINTQQLVNCVKQAKSANAGYTLLCLTAPLTAEASSFASRLESSVIIIARDKLIPYAGMISPATDEDLRAYGQTKKQRHSPKEWLAVVLDRSRTRRYLTYGFGLLLYALMFRSVFYAIPAFICISLGIACKAAQHKFSARKYWQD